MARHMDRYVRDRNLKDRNLEILSFIYEIYICSEQDLNLQSEPSSRHLKLLPASFLKKP